MTRRLAPEEYERLFTSFQHTAYRLETLQRYTVPVEEESLRRFLAGESRPYDPDKEQWLNLIRGAIGAGKRMQRVHIVVEPLSDYVRFELMWEYPDNASAGEAIHAIGTGPGEWPDDLPRHDYWLFDSRELCILRYDEKGRFVGADLVDDPVEIVQHNWWRDVALHRATPIDEYVFRRQDARNLDTRPEGKEIGGSDVSTRA